MIFVFIRLDVQQYSSGKCIRFHDGPMCCSLPHTQHRTSPSFIIADAYRLHTVLWEKTWCRWNKLVCPVLYKVTEGFSLGAGCGHLGNWTVPFCVSAQQYADSNAEQRKEAGSAASHPWSCGNMARDVLPWQQSSTDPLMVCLVCQWDSCWTDACVEIVCVCASTACLCVDGERVTQTDKMRDRVTQIDRLVWRQHANHLIRLSCNWHCGGEQSA